MRCSCSKNLQTTDKQAGQSSWGHTWRWQWVPSGPKHSKAKEEKPRDRKGRWTLCWSFTSNMAKSPFIRILLLYNAVAAEFISQHYQTKVPKYSLVQMDIVSFLCRCSPKWNKIRDAAEVSPGSKHTWNSILWQSPSNSFCTPPSRKTHPFSPEHHRHMSCFTDTWKQVL